MRSDLSGQLQIPARMKSKLESYQQSVRRVKLAEGILAALFGLLLSYILVFALDRVMETPGWLRGLILVAGSLGLGLFFPMKCHKWIWGTRRMEQVAKLLRYKFPRTSDQLLGIVELARSESEQSRSPVLVQAAMNQVDEAIKDRDFSDAVPKPKHRRWAWAVAVPTALVVGAVAVASPAASNAFKRWLMPWQETERYTFTKVNELPEEMVVPYAEKFDLSAQLRDDTKWSPEKGWATYSGQRAIRSDLKQAGYNFTVPPQKESGELNVSIGDIRETVTVTPMTRPELRGLKAIYTLPEYLQYSSDVKADVRGGVVSILAGSNAHFEARVSRSVKEATLDGSPQQVKIAREDVLSDQQVADVTISSLVSDDVRNVVLEEWLVKPGQSFAANTRLCRVTVDGEEKQLVAKAAGQALTLVAKASDSILASQSIATVACASKVTKWNKEPGDSVDEGDVVCELAVTDVITGETQTVKQRSATTGVMKDRTAHAQAFVEPQVLATLEEERVVTKRAMVSDATSARLAWTDKHGLTPRDPFVLKINALEDTPPVIGCELLDTQRVILESDTVKFDLNVSDDFGIRKIGLEWQGIADPLRNPNPDTGERVVTAGAPEETDVATVATFSAKTEGLKPQSFKVRAFAEDYLPERERSYSAVYTLHVLSADDHFAWMTQQMSRWLRSAEGVYEQELQLNDVNRQLRQLSPEELADEKTRRKISQQAAAEQANAARLAALTTNGKKMIEEAARNEQFQVGHLETWAEMMQKLEDMAANRMPSVADMLKDAAKAKAPAKGGQSKPEKTPPKAGENKGSQSGKGGEQSDKEGPKNKAPTVSDTESGMNKQDENAGGDEPPKPPSKGKLGLPGTILQGGPPEEPEACEAQEELDEAVEEQAEILAEFEEIKDALNEVMSELENSTFVKRLKAASRRQLEVAGDLNRTLLKSFGQELKGLDDRQKKRSEQLAKREVAQSENVYVIQEDLEAYFNRKQETKFKEILDDMNDTRVVTKLRGLGDRIKDNLKGESIARAEYWADTLDRWAEELVQPAPGGA
ncbi:MAG: hypothetical protein AB8G99_19535 [Planctomycetaceae bacterium]